MFNAKRELFHQYQLENKMHFNEMMLMPTLYFTCEHTDTWICLVLTHRHNHPQVEMLLHSDILSRLRAYRSLLLSSRETANTTFIVFGLTRPRHELTIYRTRAVHPDHYTTNTVGPILKDDTCTFKTPPHVLLLTSHLCVCKGIHICRCQSLSLKLFVVVFMCEAKLVCHNFLLLF